MGARLRRDAVGFQGPRRRPARAPAHRGALLPGAQRHPRRVPPRLIDVAPSPALEADLTRTLDKIADANQLDVLYTAAEALDVLRFSPRAAFSERAVRKAVALTVDRQGLVDDIFAGRARVPRSYLVPPLWAASESVPPARPDREAARRLLAQAGFGKGAHGILERGDQRMTATLLVVSGSAGRLAAPQRVAGDLAALGIAVEVHGRPATDVEALLVGGAFDLALVPETAADAALATERWVGFVDQWFDVLATAARRAPDRDAKRSFYAELQRI